VFIRIAPGFEWGTAVAELGDDDLDFIKWDFTGVIVGE
jgi:hypothetical protein